MWHCSPTHEFKCVAGRRIYFYKPQTQSGKTPYLEGDGLAIYYKRLEKGVYELPAIAADKGSATIDALQLQLILQGIVLKSVKKKKRFSLPEIKSESCAH